MPRSVFRPEKGTILRVPFELFEKKRMEKFSSNGGSYTLLSWMKWILKFLRSLVLFFMYFEIDKGIFPVQTRFISISMQIKDDINEEELRS